ncbi:tRNA pseudouridine13 synthase [Sinosporangium album]|uniref:tRNA pseudouridine13 synthase n=1 Tax=Sinosporangium album TaxID=504805 RepID=A0A1G7QKH2_9ACTN|nr:tRNA pseudouridine(13) synthase TruD [Sinosporangium album]SDF98975.1 tRNA pseudouridine13 synthase [Sinosporangium album]
MEKLLLERAGRIHLNRGGGCRAGSSPGPGRAARSSSPPAAPDLGESPMPMPLLKVRPEDFRVTEVLGLPTASRAASTHTYLRLWKNGVTTHEALGGLAAALGVAAQDTAAAGLKDEDGVTEQYISVRGLLSDRDLERANAAGRSPGGDRIWRVSAHATGTAALRTGVLDGNHFQLVVRGLDEAAAAALDEGPGRHQHFFVNYYDTQRFGVPGGPKQTHLIGRALLAGDEEAAFRLLRRSGSAEGARALVHEGTAEEFWRLLDPRVPVFYRCADASYAWNAQVRALLTEVVGGARVAHMDRDGIPYAFATARDVVPALLALRPELDYVRYRWTDGSCVRSTAARPTVLQTHITVSGVGPDELHPGRFAATISFFLPSGGYATTAVHQWFLQMFGAESATREDAAPSQDGANPQDGATAVPAGSTIA